MSRTHLLALTLCTSAGLAHAQAPDPFVGQQPQQVQAQPQAQPGQPQEPQRAARQTSVYLDVPIFLTNADIVRPGVGIHGRFGWEIGFLVPQAQVGIQANFMPAQTVDGMVLDRTTLANIWFSLGVRLQFLNRSRFVPFVDLNARFNFWSYSQRDAAGGVYANDFTFEPGILGAVGMAIELTAKLGLEVALNAMMTIPTSDVFAARNGFDSELQVVLIPWVGGTYYY